MDKTQVRFGYVTPFEWKRNATAVKLQCFNRHWFWRRHTTAFQIRWRSKETLLYYMFCCFNWYKIKVVQLTPSHPVRSLAGPKISVKTQCTKITVKLQLIALPLCTGKRQVPPGQVVTVLTVVFGGTYTDSNGVVCSDIVNGRL